MMKTNRITYQLLKKIDRYINISNIVVLTAILVIGLLSPIFTIFPKGVTAKIVILVLLVIVGINLIWLVYNSTFYIYLVDTTIYIKDRKVLHVEPFRLIIPKKVYSEYIESFDQVNSGKWFPNVCSRFNNLSIHIDFYKYSDEERYL